MPDDNKNKTPDCPHKSNAGIQHFARLCANMLQGFVGCIC